MLVADRPRLTSFIICARRVATSAYKPARLGNSLLLRLSRRSGQPYPLVADRPASHPSCKKAEKSVLESFSLFYSSIKQIILFLLFLLPFQ